MELQGGTISASSRQGIGSTFGFTLDFEKTNSKAVIKEIIERQQLLQSIIEIHKDWPETISNGSVLMIEKFYESQVENIPSRANIISSNLYKLIYAPDFSLVRYSVTH